MRLRFILERLAQDVLETPSNGLVKTAELVRIAFIAILPEPSQGIYARLNVLESETFVVTLSDVSLFRIDVFINALINVTYMLILLHLLLCIAIRLRSSITSGISIITTSFCLLDFDLSDSDHGRWLDLRVGVVPPVCLLLDYLTYDLSIVWLVPASIFH